MAAKLTVNGITFSDTTQLNSKRGIFPQSTAWIFYQSAAPTGWTKSTSHDNKALRVVSGTGGGSGGTNSFTSMMTVSYFNYSGTMSVSTPTGDTLLTTAQIPAHTHTMPTGNYAFTAVPTNLNPDSSFASWNGGDVGRPAPGGTGSWVVSTPLTGSTGSGTGHNHSVAATAPINVPISLAVQYVDVIVCTFDG
jgi:hypothetical protein